MSSSLWKNQKDFLEGNETNVLVMADTSGSMYQANRLPICNSLGLALYIAERNHGFFHNYFMTFDSEPVLQKVTGETIAEKLNGIESIVSSTNIDKAFQLLLDSATQNKLEQSDIPSHIIVISDVEFDDGVYSKGGTNFQGWKKAFEEAEYVLPKIVFWNVAAVTKGFPVTQNDGDVCMISGFSTAILQTILDVENFNPVDVMMETLKTYLEMLGGENHELS